MISISRIEELDLVLGDIRNYGCRLASRRRLLQPRHFLCGQLHGVSRSGGLHFDIPDGPPGKLRLQIARPTTARHQLDTCAMPSKLPSDEFFFSTPICILISHTHHLFPQNQVFILGAFGRLPDHLPQCRVQVCSPHVLGNRFSAELPPIRPITPGTRRQPVIRVIKRHGCAAVGACIGSDPWFLSCSWHLTSPYSPTCPKPVSPLLQQCSLGLLSCPSHL